MGRMGTSGIQQHPEVGSDVGQNATKPAFSRSEANVYPFSMSRGTYQTRCGPDIPYLAIKPSKSQTVRCCMLACSGRYGIIVG